MVTVKNPNALVGAVSGIGGGQIVINLARLFGWNVSTGWALTIAGAATYVVLFVGRNGLVGVWHVLKFGAGNTPPVAK